MFDHKGRPWLRKPAAGDIIALRQTSAAALAGFTYVKVTGVGDATLACETIAGSHCKLTVSKSDFSHIMERANGNSKS
tara:strand:- start:3068 stop:3301 length:234 start_codon:yes stop_codon:yes gene_type:complete